MLPPTASSLLSRLCKYFSFSQPVSRIICFIILKCFPFVNGIFLLPNIFSNLLSFSHNCGRFFVMFTTPNFIYPLHGSTAYAGRQSQPAMHSNRRMAGQNCLCSLHFRRKHQTWDRYIRTHRNPAPGLPMEAARYGSLISRPRSPGIHATNSRACSSLAWLRCLIPLSLPLASGAPD